MKGALAWDQEPPKVAFLRLGLGVAELRTVQNLQKPSFLLLRMHIRDFHGFCLLTMTGKEPNKHRVL